MKNIERIMYSSRSSFNEVGKNGVEKIYFHSAMYEGDKSFCTVYFEDGAELQIFDIDEIFWRSSNENH